MPAPLERLQAALQGRYHIDREIGRGGSAVVVAAHDLQHQRPVAIKLMRAEVVVSPDRFQREILMIARLQHPNIVPLFDSGQVDDVPYYVMPLIEGTSLRQYLETTPVLPIDYALNVAVEVADALAYAHGKGLLHRDVKPENILLSAGHAMLSDFGIARAIAQSASSYVTGAGIAVGTPAYMSPEQASGADIDERSDQYSLACVVFEMLSGQVPRRGSTPQPTDRSAPRTGPDLRKLRHDVPRSVSTALSRALSPDPRQRFDGMTPFSDALLGQRPDRVDSGSRRVDLASIGRSISRRQRRLGAIVVLLLLVAVGAVVRLSRITSPGSDRTSLDPRRVAVLYFDDHSSDQSLGHLASGLTEGLIHELTAVGALQVISRNGVKPFRSGQMSLDSIARLLNVGSIVEGSVQKSGNRIKVTVQLIDARTGAHRGSREIVQELGDLFLLEDELSRTVAAEFRRTIGIELRMREHVAATRSVAARELVWRADRERDRAAEMVAGRSPEDVRNAVIVMRRADSLLAAAEREDRLWVSPIVDRGWVELELASMLSAAERSPAFRAGMAHAERALRREPHNAAALELRGTWLYTEAERGAVAQDTVRAYLASAERDLRRAVDLDSTLATAWGTLSRVRRAAGDIGEAQRMATTALAMDAYLRDAPSILSALFSATLMSDSLDASWRWCRRGALDHPGDVRFVQCQLTLLAEDFRYASDADSAERLVRRAKELDPPERAATRGRPWQPVYRDMMYAVVLARSGLTDSAMAIASRARVTVQESDVMRVDLMYELALLQLVVGDKSRAIQLLSGYLEARPYLRELVAKHPRWKPLRDEPAFRDLTRTTSPVTSAR